MNILTKNPVIGVSLLFVIVALGGWLFMGGEPTLHQATQKSGTFSAETNGLPAAKSSPVAELTDGDTYNLEATIVQKTINGQPVKMLAYNGSIPGPLIKVTQGSEVTINFTNNTDVATTIHSHGVRLRNEFDGTPDLTQEPIPVGGTFMYTIIFPDVGMFWYHPHVREDYAQELGLSGNYLVVSADLNYWQPVNQEVPLMLDDILMENGRIASFDRSVANHTLMGDLATPCS